MKQHLSLQARYTEGDLKVQCKEGLLRVHLRNIFVENLKRGFGQRPNGCRGTLNGSVNINAVGCWSKVLISAQQRRQKLCSTSINLVSDRNISRLKHIWGTTLYPSHPTFYPAMSSLLTNIE
jgi:hypothetical protein